MLDNHTLSNMTKDCEMDMCIVLVILVCIVHAFFLIFIF